MTKHATMCSNTTKTARRSTRSMKKTTPATPSSARKTRTKTRKHRFLSLRRHLFSKQPPPTSPEPYSSGEMTSRDAHQLNLFPLHPENLFQDKDDNVPITCFFDADTSAGAAPTTLDGLLWGGVSEEEEEDTCSLYSPSSLTCPGGAQDSEGSNSNSYSLERAAFVRSNVREREESEEKWVRYEEVIGWSGEHWKRDSRGLSLKLDYQEIMNAWMDKGPLYIDGDGPAIVPDLLHDAPQQQQQQQQEQQDCSTSTVKVPVLGADDEGREVGEGWKMGQNREARVLRYKEKRQSRLFAKRIRYEVRKLNAEKRPRLKGRFVKRN